MQVLKDNNYIRFMDFGLAREIYGLTPWMVDSPTFSALYQMLKDFRNGVPFSSNGDKLNNIFLFDTRSGTSIITSPDQIDSSLKGDDLIYVLNLNGAITKNGGMSSYGTKQLSQLGFKLDGMEQVKGGIILGDSGGGSSAGIDPMAHFLQNKKKPVVSLVERGGVSASAAYGIMSYADYFMAESKTATVGSIGTMISFAAHPHQTIDGDGAKHITMYATASTKKNKAFEEALNNDNYELIISEILDPANEIFMQSIRDNRKNVLESQLDGSVYKAGDVLGTLIDEIGSFEVAASKVLQLYGGGGKLKINSKVKDKAMTKEELKAAHPEVYASIFNEGVTAESERVGSWMAHAQTDMVAVQAGIDGGKEITPSVREKLLVKAHSKTALQNIKLDSAGKLITQEAADETTTELTAEEKADAAEFEKIYGKHKIKFA